MQFLARLMDHALEQRGERATIVVATSGDTGGAAVEAFRGRNRIDLVVLFPRRPRLRRAAPDDDHGGRRQRPCGRGRGHVRRLPGAREGHVQPSRLRAISVRLSGVNSINWARIVAQVVYYFTAAVALGAPHRKVAFTVPTGNFGDIFAGYVARRMGLPIDRLVIATNVNDILVRTLATGTYEPREVVATSSPSMDIQVSSNFERLLFEAYGRDGRRCAALMASSRSRGASRSRRPRSPRSAPVLPPAAPTRTRSPPPCARHCARPAISSIRTPRSASRSPRRSRATRSMPMVVLATAHAAKFPGCGRGGLRRAAATAGLAVRPRSSGASTSPRCRPIRRRSKHSYSRPRGPRAKELPHERRSDPSAVRPDRRDRRHAASGDRLARRLGRCRQPRRTRRRARHLASARAHGVQGHQAAHRAPDRRGDRGGRRRPQRRDLDRDHRLLRARAEGRRAARARRAVRHPCRTRPSIRRN